MTEVNDAVHEFGQWRNPKQLPCSYLPKQSDISFEKQCASNMFMNMSDCHQDYVQLLSGSQNLFFANERIPKDSLVPGKAEALPGPLSKTVPPCHSLSGWVLLRSLANVGRGQHRPGKRTRPLFADIGRNHILPVRNASFEKGFMSVEIPPTQHRVGT